MTKFYIFGGLLKPIIEIINLSTNPHFSSLPVMAISDVVGNFEVGKQFDALLVDPGVEDSPFDVFSTDTREDIIQKFLFLGE